MYDKQFEIKLKKQLEDIENYFLVKYSIDIKRYKETEYEVFLSQHMILCYSFTIQELQQVSTFFKEQSRVINIKKTFYSLLQRRGKSVFNDMDFIWKTYSIHEHIREEKWEHGTNKSLDEKTLSFVNMLQNMVIKKESLDFVVGFLWDIKASSRSRRNPSLLLYRNLAGYLKKNTSETPFLTENKIYTKIEKDENGKIARTTIMPQKYTLQEFKAVQQDRIEQYMKNLCYSEDGLTVKKYDYQNNELERKKAETTNFASGFLEAYTKNSTMIFSTYTLSGELHGGIKTPHDIEERLSYFSKFRNYEKDHNIYKIKNNGKAQKHYINKKDKKHNAYVYMYEPHGDLTPHQHKVQFLKDEWISIELYLKMELGKYNKFPEQGRTDIVLEHKYKEEFLKHFTVLKTVKDNKTTKYVLAQKGSGNMLMVSFLRSEKGKQKAREAVFKYIFKYVNKTANVNMTNKDGTIDKNYLFKFLLGQLYKFVMSQSRTNFKYIYRKAYVVSGATEPNSVCGIGTGVKKKLHSAVSFADYIKAKLDYVGTYNIQEGSYTKKYKMYDLVLENGERLTVYYPLVEARYFMFREYRSDYKKVSKNYCDDNEKKFESKLGVA